MTSRLGRCPRRLVPRKTERCRASKLLANALRMNHTGMTLGAACGLAGEKSMNRSGSWATWGSAVLLLALSSSAAAKATLNARFTNATCDLNTGLAVVSGACSPLPEIGNVIGFDAVIPRGGSASVTATLVYTYADDGLPLEDYGVFYLDRTPSPGRRPISRPERST